MRREYVDYKNGLALKMTLLRIEDYPIHWNDSLEIVFVLKGSIKLGIDSYENILQAGDIEIINIDEVRWYRGIDLENLVMIINIRPEFFELYYPEAKDLFFYTDIDSNTNKQYSLKYRRLRSYLSILIFEYISKLDDYQEYIEKYLIRLMFHLVNDFHYLYYEGENLEEDDEELERYHRIIRYLNKNYMNKVSLQEIADREYLSSQYLSYKIKDTFGLGFNEYLNLIRVRESVKLLLSTDRSISDISEAVGFSHVRYFNRHFKRHFNKTPLEYRKAYKIEEKELDELKSIKNYSLDNALAYIERYIQDYNRYYWDGSISRLDIDLKGESVGYFKGLKYLYLGEAIDLLGEKTTRLLKKIKEEIDFKYGIVDQLFSPKMVNLENPIVNWYRVEEVLFLLIDLNIDLKILADGLDEDLKDEFISYFLKEYSLDLRPCLIKKEDLKKKNILLDDIRSAYDSFNILFPLLDNYIGGGRKYILGLKDNLEKPSLAESDSFLGQANIYTSKGLKKPSYYGLMLLSLMGEEIISQGDGYIVTRSQNSYQIILYNPSNIDGKNHLDREELYSRKLSLNLYNMDGDFKLRKYLFTRENSSVYDKWVEMGRPARISREDIYILKNYLGPDISYSLIGKQTVLNILERIEPYNIIFYSLEYI